MHKNTDKIKNTQRDKTDKQTNYTNNVTKCLTDLLLWFFCCCKNLKRFWKVLGIQAIPMVTMLF